MLARVPCIMASQPFLARFREDEDSDSRKSPNVLATSLSGPTAVDGPVKPEHDQSSAASAQWKSQTRLNQGSWTAVRPYLTALTMFSCIVLYIGS